MCIKNVLEKHIFFSYFFVFSILSYNSIIFAQQDYTDVRIFQSTNAQTENSIAINPKDPKNILVCTNGTPAGVVNRFYSTDGGNTWNGIDHNPEGIVSSGDPVAFFDANGNAYCAYLGPNGPVGVYISKSTDKGATWGNPVNAVSSTLFRDDKPHAAAGISGNYSNNIYVAWTGHDDATQDSYKRVYFSRSTDGGSSFQTKQLLNGGRNIGANLAIGPDDAIYVAFAILPSDNSSHIEGFIAFRKSTDGGQSFQALPAFSISGLNNYGDTGQQEFNDIKVNSFPSMGVDRSPSTRNSWVYIVYADKSTGDADIYLRKSTNAGASWSNAIRVNNDASGTQQWFPSLSVDQITGNIIISYYNMTVVGSPYTTKRYIAVSTDGGDSFSHYIASDESFIPKPLGAGFNPAYMGDYYETAAYGSQAFACWSDDRSGVFQAYISKFTLPVAVTLDQKLEDNITRVGTIGRWVTNSFSPRIDPNTPITVQGGPMKCFKGIKRCTRRKNTIVGMQIQM